MEALPVEQPAATFDDEIALLTHRDFALLADAEGAALAEDLAFLSWLSNQPEIAEAREAADDDEDAADADADADTEEDADAAP